ncbi:MAG TPA: FKBP-type peptidyl-prolyl cis-trans isomerase [Actinomycetaceae bacterium]|nr:FKBP-type peptidyl-prolyl cis-trans isomerase [Actinomycetaceae bacterium]
MTAVVLPEVRGEFGTKPTISFPQDAAPNGLQIHVLRPGHGVVIEPGREIEVNYLGQIWNGHVFDNSYDRGQPLTFPIGRGMVIKGWDHGLVGQQVGARVLLTIPPRYGYGSRGVPQARIGGQDTLVFVVDVIDVR